MKRAFKSSWHADQVCLKSMAIESDIQPSIGTSLVSASTISLTHNHGFEKLLLRAVDGGLSSLGDSSKQALYTHLENVFNINKEEIPDRMNKFAEALEEIFGFGARLLEIRIMKCLYEEVGETFKYVPKQVDLKFSEYLAAAHDNLE